MALILFAGSMILLHKAASSPSWKLWMAVTSCVWAATLVIVVLAWRGARTSWITPLSNRARAALIGGCILLGLPELIALKSGIDWDEKLGNEVTPEMMPVYFRTPSVRVESVFFRKPGNTHWEGRPLTLLMHNSKGTDTTYADEPVTSIDYDADGFRNTPPLTDWDVAVIGDSYTELGYLPYDALFTTLMSRSIGLRVRNIGASSSGPLTYACFARHFAKAPSCRHAMFIFFEGNDVEDCETEWLALQQYERTGVPPNRDYIPQASLLTAVWKSLPLLVNPYKPKSYANAWLRFPDREVPITFSDVWLPPDPAQLTAQKSACLERALAQMKDAATHAGLKPWLVYLPACNRIYEGKVRFSNTTPRAAMEWKRNNLPDHIAKLCEKHGLTFLDTTAQLQSALDSGRMVYNPIRDFHLNAEGCKVVSDVMSAAIGMTKPE